jgi:hypothetical protein
MAATKMANFGQAKLRTMEPSGEATQQRRGAADRGEYRQAAGASSAFTISLR